MFGLAPISGQGLAALGTVVVLSCTPNAGTQSGGTSVTIATLNAKAGATVRFGATAPKSVSVTAPNQITCVTNACDSNNMDDVTVTNTASIDTCTAHSLYDRTSNSGIFPIDPQTLICSGYWIDYGGSTPWPGTASAGASGSTSMITGSIFVDPAAGSTLNGHPTAAMNGTTNGFEGSAATTSMLGTDGTVPYGWSMCFVALATSLATDASSGVNGFLNACLFTDPQAVVGTDLSSDGGVQAFQIDEQNGNENYNATPGTGALATGSYFLAQARWDGANTIYSRVAKGSVSAWSTGLMRPPCFPTGADQPYFGVNYNQTVNLTGNLAAIVITQKPWSTYTMDGVGAFFQRRYAQSFGFDVLSELPAAYSPDYLWRRSTYDAARQQAYATNVAPVVAATTPTLPLVSYPNTVPRPQIAVASQAYLASIQKPEGQLPLDWQPSYPPTATRAPLPVADRAHFATSPQPERAAPLADVRYPDTVPGPKFPPHQQLHVTELSPAPENTQALDWLPRYPDPPRRPAMPPSEQKDFSFAPAPERTAPMATAIYPDSVDRAKQHARHQQPITNIAPAPENTNPLDWLPVVPDRALRAPPTPDSRIQYAPSPAPENTVPNDWQPIYPERPVRAAHPTDARAQFAISMEPENTIAMDWQPVYPERPIRAPLAIDLRHRFATSQQPENTIALDWMPSFPDHPMRPVFAAAMQLAEVFSPLPIPNAPLTPIDLSVYPDYLWRAAFATANHKPSNEIAPLPIPNAPFTPYDLAVYQDYLPRPVQPAPRAPYAASNIAPEGELPLDWQPSFPERAPGAAYPTADRSHFAPSTQPENTRALDWMPSYPPSVFRPFARAADQRDLHRAPAPEGKIALDWQPLYQDRVPRPAFAAGEQRDLSRAPAPENTIAMDWQPVYPERVPRPALSTAQQPFYAAPTTLEAKLPLDWQPTFPSYLPLPGRVAHSLSALVLSTQLITTPQLAAVVYPDRVLRPIPVRTGWVAVITDIIVNPLPPRGTGRVVAVVVHVHASADLQRNVPVVSTEHSQPVAATTHAQATADAQQEGVVATVTKLPTPRSDT